MTDEEKIKLLLQTKDKQNNYLALQLMINHLGKSYSEALQKLLLVKEEHFLYSFSVLDVKVAYEYWEHKYLYFAYGSSRIVYFQGKKVENLSQSVLAIDERPPEIYKDKIALLHTIKNEDLVNIATEVQTLIEQ